MVVDRAIPPAPAPVREFHFPRVERSTIGNDLAVLSTTHGALPVVTLLMVAHAGAEHDARVTSGIAYLTARALEAGTATRTAERVAWAFETLGAELDVNVVWDCATLSITVARDKVEPALALLAEIVSSPAFLDDEIDRLKSEQLSELEQRKAEPRALASDMASRFIFTPDVPYAWPIAGTGASIRHLTPDHVRAFYHAHWTAGSCALIAVGPIDHNEVERLAGRHLGGWTGRSTVPAEFEVASPIERTQVFLVDRQGAVQSELRVGHVGVARSSPDYFALAVANAALGGVFTSRLNMSLREEHGFTYGVRSGFAFRKQPGPFLIHTAVASDVTARALAEMLRVTRTFLQEGVYEDETVGTREYLAGVLPLELQTTEQMAHRLSDIFIYDLSNDYLPQHRAALLGVSRDETNQAAREHIHPERIAITIVGDARAIENEIADLGLGAIEVHTADE